MTDTNLLSSGIGFLLLAVCCIFAWFFLDAVRGKWIAILIGGSCAIGIALVAASFS